MEQTDAKNIQGINNFLDLQIEGKQQTNRNLLGQKKIQKQETLQNQIENEQFFNIIQKTPETRIPSDIQKCMNFLKKIPYFENIQRKYSASTYNTVMDKISRHLKMVFLLEGNILYAAQERSDIFYIILKGELVQLISKPKEHLEKQKSEITKNTNSIRQIENFISNWFPHFNRRKGVQEQLNRKTLSSSSTIIVNKQKLVRQQSILQTIDTFINNEEQEKIQKTQLNSEQQVNISEELDNTNNNVQAQTSRSPTKQRTMQPRLSKMFSSKIVRDKLEQADANTKILQSELQLAFQYMQLNKLQNPEYYFDGNAFKFQALKNIKFGETLGSFEILSNRSHQETVVAIQDCHVGYLNRQEFLNILKVIEDIKMNKKIEIICKSFTSQNQDIRKAMSTLIQNLEQVEFQKNQNIFSEGDKAKWIYIIKNGEVEIQKESLNQPPQSYTEQNLYMKMPQKIQQVQIAIMGEGQFLGESDILQKRTKFSYSALCLSSKVKLFKIDKSKFLKFLQDQPLIHEIFHNRINQQEQFSHQKFNKLSTIIKTEYQSKFIPIHNKDDEPDEFQIIEELKQQQQSQIQYSFKQGVKTIKERSKQKGASRDTYDKYSSVIQNQQVSQNSLNISSNQFLQTQQDATPKSKLQQSSEHLKNNNNNNIQNDFSKKLPETQKTQKDNQKKQGSNKNKQKNSQNLSYSNGSTPKNMRPVYQEIIQNAQVQNMEIFNLLNTNTSINNNKIEVEVEDMGNIFSNDKIVKSPIKITRSQSEVKANPQRIASARQRNFNQDLTATAVQSNYEKQIQQSHKKRKTNSRSSNRNRAISNQSELKQQLIQQKNQEKKMDIIQYQAQNDTFARTRMFLAANFYRKPYKETLGIRMTTDGSLPFKCLFEKVKNQVVQNCKARMETAPNEDKMNFIGPILKPYTPIESLYAESYHQWSNPTLIKLEQNAYNEYSNANKNQQIQQYHTRSQSLFNTATNFVKTSDHFYKNKDSNLYREGQQKLKSSSYHKNDNRTVTKEQQPQNNVNFSALLSNLDMKQQDLINQIETNKKILFQQKQYSENYKNDYNATFQQNFNSDRSYLNNQSYNSTNYKGFATAKQRKTNIIKNQQFHTPTKTQQSTNSFYSKNDSQKKSIVIVNHMGKPIKYYN